MTDKLATRIYIYDSICNAYSKLHNVEKDDFDKGLTMLFNNPYFAKNKKSNINYNSPIIFEIMNLSTLAINLSNQISGTDKFNKLTNFSSTEEFNTFFDELIIGKKINGKVLLNFLRVIKSMAVISIIAEVKEEEEIKKIISEINLSFDIIQTRFNFDLNRKPIELKNEFIGKLTIILIEKCDINLTRLLIELKEIKLISKAQDIDAFKGVFRDKEIKPNQRVVWIGNNSSLMFFLQAIIDLTVFTTLKELYITATRCFVKENGISFEFKEISNSRGNSNIKEAIKTAIINSLPDSKQKK
jgi:hypothetical protein